MNNRGNALDMPFMVVALTIFAITVIITGAMTHFIIDGLGNSGNEYAELGYNNTQELPAKAVEWGDFMFAFMFAGFWLILYVSAFFIRVSPLFVGLGVFVLIITVIISAVFSNLMLDFLLQGDTLFSLFSNPDVSVNYPLTVHLMSKLPYYISVLGGVLLIILYSKTGDE